MYSYIMYMSHRVQKNLSQAQKCVCVCVCINQSCVDTRSLAISLRLIGAFLNLLFEMPNTTFFPTSNLNLHKHWLTQTHNNFCSCYKTKKQKTTTNKFCCCCCWAKGRDKRLHSQWCLGFEHKILAQIWTDVWVTLGVLYVHMMDGHFLLKICAFP